MVNHETMVKTANVHCDITPSQLCNVSCDCTVHVNVCSWCIAGNSRYWLFVPICINALNEIELYIYYRFLCNLLLAPHALHLLCMCSIVLKHCTHEKSILTIETDENSDVVESLLKALRFCFSITVQ